MIKEKSVKLWHWKTANFKGQLINWTLYYEYFFICKTFPGPRKAIIMCAMSVIDPLIQFINANPSNMTKIEQMKSLKDFCRFTPLLWAYPIIKVIQLKLIDFALHFERLECWFERVFGLSQINQCTEVSDGEFIAYEHNIFICITLIIFFKII